MNNKSPKKVNHPTEESLRWDYLLVKEFLPTLGIGTVVLVQYFGRNRVAIVRSKLPGRCYWGQLCSPVSGQTRVVISKNSLIAVALNEK